MAPPGEHHIVESFQPPVIERRMGRRGLDIGGRMNRHIDENPLRIRRAIAALRRADSKSDGTRNSNDKEKT
jgi:hypothetical protein